MKKILLFVLGAALCACTSKNPDDIVVNVEVENMTVSNVGLLIDRSTSFTIPLDKHGKGRLVITGLGNIYPRVIYGQTAKMAFIGRGEEVTLRFDGPGGLGADEQYRNQLEALRGQGARLCEAVRLAFEPSFGTPRNLAKLFETAFEAACRGVLPSDVVIECHPRHARFYRRVLGMAQLGPLSLCRRVHAPAVLMYLPLARLAAWLGRTAGWTRH